MTKKVRSATIPHQVPADLEKAITSTPTTIAVWDDITHNCPKSSVILL